MRTAGKSGPALVGAAGLAVCLACTPGGGDADAFTGLADAPKSLSAFGMFEGDLADHRPATGVVPFDLTTPLFSDYTEKLRFVRLPEGASATYDAVASFDFPVGTILSKTFALPAGSGRSERRLLETRILAHLPDGWIGLPYIWNEDQTQATLRIAGGMLKAEWTEEGGAVRDYGHLVPNANQCKGCHEATALGVGPLGPKARYLNRDFAYVEGSENQLAHWTRAGILAGAPEPAIAPRVPVWDDAASGSLDGRARAYLEMNCAHCHNPEGPARTTGLDLSWSADHPVDLGVYKFPVAAGRGSGDRLFGIVPGKPDESILMYRMLSVDPGVMMPELGRRRVHTEGVALLGEWITAMPEPERRSRPMVLGSG